MPPFGFDGGTVTLYTHLHLPMPTYRKDTEMPNHCNNTLVVTGSYADLAAFINAAYNGDNTFSLLEKFIPRPDTLVGDEWLNWSITNWGTKWSEYNLRVHTLLDEIQFRFDTAWAPPTRGLLTISGLFPNLTFNLAYDEEGMGFAGVMKFKNNNIIHNYAISENEMPQYEEGREDEYMDDMALLRERLLMVARS